MDSRSPADTADLWKQLSIPDAAKTLQPTNTIRPARATTGSTPSAEPATTSTTKLAARLAELPTQPIDEGASLATVQPDGGAVADLQLVGELGHGGMGVVQRVLQRSLGREVAVKRIRKKKGASARAVTRLLDEARIAGSLEHPNIIPIHALGTDQSGDPLIVMKRVEGAPWKRMLRDATDPTWRHVTGDRLRWNVQTLMQVCRAIEFAHARGVVHRDLKPDNVMIGNFGEVYVLDWGVALELGEDGTAAQRLGGTPAYMAPETLNQKPATPRTDVYLLGAILHEILTRQPLHVGATFYDLVAQIHHSKDVEFGPDAPRELAAICNKATAKRPKDRYPSVRAFRDALADYLEHRASTELAAEAHQTLAAFEAERHQPTGDPHLLRRLSTECRFGFGHALNLWPDNIEAQRGLQLCLEAMVDLELSDSNEAGANALLAEMDAPSARLRDRVAALSERLERQRSNVRELEAIAHSQDINVLAKTRARQLVAMAGVALIFAVGMVAAHRFSSWKVTYGFLLPLALAPPIVVGGVIYFFRNQSRNLINRNLLWGLLAATSMVGLIRWLGYRAGVPVETAMMFELAASAGIGIVAAIVIERRAAKPAVLCILCAVAAGVWQNLVIELTALGTAGGLLWVGIIWYRSKPAS